MTPIIHIRSFSDDQYLLDKIFYANSYRLRGNKDKNIAPIILDIGAHCGYFTFCALSLGAKKVYSIEPFIENYKILLKNVGDNFNVVPYQIAISSEKNSLTLGYPKPEKSFLNLSKIEPIITEEEPRYVCPSNTLDGILSEYIQEEFIDILKINIGYNERDILQTSKLLEMKVKNICGETIIEPEYVASFKAEMAAKGFINSHIISSLEEQNRISFVFSKGDIAERFSL